MLRMVLVLSLLLPSMAAAQTVELGYDSYESGQTAGTDYVFANIFERGDCWGTIFEPDVADLPIEPTTVDMVVGGAADTVDFIVTVYRIDGAGGASDMLDAELLGRASFSIAGDDSSLQSIDLDGLHVGRVEDGMVVVSVCASHDALLPAIANDLDGIVQPSRNIIQIDGGDWEESTLHGGISGDWIMRLNARIRVDLADDDPEDDTGDDDQVGVTSITPDWASEGESISVLISGWGFGEGAIAYIGDYALAGISLSSDSEHLNGRTDPSMIPGVYSVTVRLIDGTENGIGDAFTVLGPDDKTTCGCGGGGLAGLLAALSGFVLAVARRRMR